MALKARATIKAALDAAAAELTLAYADTVTGIARELKDPHTGLRQLNKLFTIDEEGVVTVDGDAFNALYGAADVYRGVISRGESEITKKIIS